MIRTAIAGSLLWLSACGSPQSEESNGSAAVVSEVRLEPGEWEVETQTGDQADGAPDLAAAMAGEGTEEDKMKAIVAAMSSTERMCITPEKAAALFADDAGEGCKREGEGWRNGHIITKVTCAQKDAPQASVHQVSGRYTARSFDITQKLDEVSDGETTTITVKSTGRRIGDCPAGK